LKIKEGILPGALVRCLDDSNQQHRIIKRDFLYTVQGTLLQGSYIYLEGTNGFYNRDRFVLIYNHPDDFFSDFDCEGIC
jgi:hypothetical protein